MDTKTAEKIIQKWKDAKDLFVRIMDKPANFRDAGDRIVILRLLDMIELEEQRRTEGLLR